MIELTIKKEDIARVRRMLNELDPKAQGKAIHIGMSKACSTVLGRLVENVSGLVLKRRTGNLAKSMGYRISQDEKGNFEGIIGSGASLKLQRVVYANIHETGGTIRPKVAKMLAIPIGQALTPAGVARFNPRDITSEGYDKSFIRRSKAGNLILFGTRADKVIPLFLLKNKVTIPARRYMSITVEQTKDQVVNDIVDKIKEAKEKA